MSSGHGVVPHGGIGLAAASIEQIDRLAAGRGPRDDVLAVLQVQALPGLVAVPHQALGGEARPCRRRRGRRSADDLRALPVRRDRRAACGTTWCPTRRPTARPTSNGSYVAAARLGHADRLAVHVVGRHRERHPVAVDRRSHDPFHDPVDPSTFRFTILEHRRHAGTRSLRADVTWGDDGPHTRAGPWSAPTRGRGRPGCRRPAGWHGRGPRGSARRRASRCRAPDRPTPRRARRRGCSSCRRGR